MYYNVLQGLTPLHHIQKNQRKRQTISRVQHRALINQYNNIAKISDVKYITKIYMAIIQSTKFDHQIATRINFH